MSIGYFPPVPPFTGGFSAGEVRDNLPAAIARATKAQVGMTADLRPVYRLVAVTSWQEYATEEQARHVCQEWKNDTSWSARYFDHLPAGEILDTDPE